MLRILETETVSYLAYATARTENFLLGHLYQFALDVLLRRTPCFFLDEISEIIGRQVHPVCKIFHGRQPLRLRMSTLEISIQLFFKSYQNVFVHLAPRNKLPFIKTHAIIQQKFDVADNEAAAMFVHRTGQLHLDFLQTVSVNAFLFVGQMKSLIRSIRKEGILLDVLP